MELRSATELILSKRSETPQKRGLLVGISGIDGCGKGYLAACLQDVLVKRGAHVACINVDGWLNLPETRFSPVNPAQHFYDNGLRLAEMFTDLVLPLKANRSWRVEMNYVEETATAYRNQTYEFCDVDIILVEGIFLFKRLHRRHCDLTFWIDCTFETALARALARRQEGLSAAATIRAYQTIYFAAQKIHMERDDPRSAASAIIPNDSRLAAELQ
ncbi:MAG: hypothetical protein L0Y72_04560 [Gemmataceae bacterium]|nr:hypothetical protein [Gemmataceae bacterium]